MLRFARYSAGSVFRAQVAELVDALRSGRSDLTVVEVRVLSWHQLLFPISPNRCGETQMVQLRPILENELTLASQLCLRSKGYWGYDDAFLEACKRELTLTEEDMKRDPIIVAEDERGMAGVAHVFFDESGCYLDKLFVDTDRIGQGIGQVLFKWSVSTARDLGAKELIIEADPGAAPFYEKMGCIIAGQATSGSVEGRVLPRLIFRL